MVKLRMTNSRMKDFFDIWLLSRQFDFQGSVLAEAIRHTFGRRNILLPLEVEAFTEAFVQAKQEMWTLFLKQHQLDSVPVAFGEVTNALDNFLSPILMALAADQPSPPRWIAPGPWS